ncbi:MAG: hypothetical protein MI976_16450, partial [Pseudomonadales bacterium]|nr:hypothetical protein [Pseudomonadales bacterium]
DTPQKSISFEIELIEIGMNGANNKSVQLASLKKNQLGASLESPFSTASIASLVNNLSADSATAQLSNGINIATIEDSDSPSYAALLQAQLNESKVNLLSKPKIIGVSNQETRFFAGQNIPVLTGQASGDGTNPFNAIERKDVGIELTLTPTLIPKSAEIHLDVNLEISAISPAAQVNGASDIITNKRKIDTNLNITSGSTLVLGGLISENHQHSESTIPGFSRIPIVGSLFNSTRNIYDRKILVAFVTAEIQDPTKIYNPPLVLEQEQNQKNAKPDNSHIANQQFAEQE